MNVDYTSAVNMLNQVASSLEHDPMAIWRIAAMFVIAIVIGAMAVKITKSAFKMAVSATKFKTAGIPQFLVGLMVLGVGVGSAIQANNERPSLPAGFSHWSLAAQKEYLEERETIYQASLSEPRQFNLPWVVTIPLIFCGGGLAIVGGVSAANGAKQY